MVTILYQETVTAICNLENNLAGRYSIAKIKLVSGSNTEKNNLMAAAGVPKINLESKGYMTIKLTTIKESKGLRI